MSNKSIMLMSAGALLMASSCASDINEPDVKNPGAVSDGNAKYITVAISGLPDAGNVSKSSRAGEVFDGQDPAGNASYEYGSEEENKVNKVRFYFFDDNGAAANVKLIPEDGSYINYFDWSVNDNEGDDAPNVEKILKATIVINTKAGDQLPKRIAAVVNPSNLLGDGSLDLSMLRNISGDYKSSIKDYDFTMSSSVYLGMNNTEVTSTPIPDTSIQDTPQGAMLQPVVVYVERVVAKVRVKVDALAFGDRLTTINGGMAIALVDSEGQKIEADGRQVYARFSNWNLTGTTTRSWLNKHINAAWASNTDFSWDWNYPTFFRSYWAWNCPNAGRNYYSFNEITSATGKPFGTNSSELYCSENAASYGNFDNGAGDQYPTCGILGATLCYEDGTPVEFYKFLGETHVGETNLINAMLSSIQSRHQLYAGSIENGQKVFREITADDIELETAAAAGKVELSNASQGRYHSYLTLSLAGSGKKWFPSDSQDQDIEKDFMKENDVINFIQETTGSVSLWNDGMTYYYFPIEHFGKVGDDGYNYGKYGVVRNHIYDSTITKLYGLGTPVYNPDETIYPEKPQDNDSYIAAQIDILSWRLVKNNVELEWPD
ncbi:MAG: Mfa1 family fimbria major subunit [Muribaculaceae bacterium]|nr:Mfa1 family fimbria major subunit [Muribaculaceae bacterium]